jgi:hypothetical protein
VVTAKGVPPGEGASSLGPSALRLLRTPFGVSLNRPGPAALVRHATGDRPRVSADTRSRRPQGLIERPKWGRRVIIGLRKSAVAMPAGVLTVIPSTMPYGGLVRIRLGERPLFQHRPASRCLFRAGGTSRTPRCFGTTRPMPITSPRTARWDARTSGDSPSMSASHPPGATCHKRGREAADGVQ